jgi:hypothetical protein
VLPRAVPKCEGEHATASRHTMTVVDLTPEASRKGPSSRDGGRVTLRRQRRRSPESTKQRTFVDRAAGSQPAGGVACHQGPVRNSGAQ